MGTVLAKGTFNFVPSIWSGFKAIAIKGISREDASSICRKLYLAFVNHMLQQGAFPEELRKIALRHKPIGSRGKLKLTFHMAGGREAYCIINYVIIRAGFGKGELGESLEGQCVVEIME